MDTDCFKVSAESDGRAEQKRGGVRTSKRTTTIKVSPEGCRPKIPLKQDTIKAPSKKRGIGGTLKKRGCKDSRKKGPVSSTRAEDVGRPLTFRPVEVHVPLPVVSLPIECKLINLEAQLVRANELVDKAKEEMTERLAAVDFEREVLYRKENVLCAQVADINETIEGMKRVVIFYEYLLEQQHKKQAEERARLEDVRMELCPLVQRRDILKSFLTRLKPCKVLVSGFLDITPEFNNLEEAREEAKCQLFGNRVLSDSEAVLQRALIKARERDKEFYSVNPADEKRTHDSIMETKWIYFKDLQFEEQWMSIKFLRTKDHSMETKVCFQQLCMGILRMFSLLREKVPVILVHRGDHVEMMRRIGDFIYDWDELQKSVKAIVAETERKAEEDQKRRTFLRGLFRIKIKSQNNKDS